MSIEIYNILTISVAAVTMAVTATIAVIQMRKTARQAMQQNRIAIFTEYTRRYHDLMNHIPEDIFKGESELDERTKKYLRLYFDLCSEEYYLNRRQDLIPVQVWQYWQDGMRTMMGNELYQQCWEVLKKEYNEPFREFMEKTIIRTITNQE